MRICHIVPWFPSKIPTTLESRQGLFEYRQIQNLTKFANEIKVISIKWPGQDEYEKFGDAIDVYRIPYIFEMLRYPFPNFFKLIRVIKKIVLYWNPDILVFSHMEYLTGLPSIYLKNKLNVPIIVIIDSLPGFNWQSGNPIVDLIAYFNSILIGKMIFKSADGIHFLSYELCKFVKKLNIDENKVFIITRGVDTNAFRPTDKNDNLKESLGIEKNDRIILYVGRLDPIKGVNNLILSAKDLLNIYKDIKFIIVGDGSLRSELESLAKPFLGKIIFTGYRDNIAELMNIADIFVLPSLSEGAANVVLEASASGLPVVATKVGQIPKIVLDAKTGLLIEPKDILSLKNSLRYLLDNPTKGKEMGVSGRNHIIENYGWEIITEKILMAYENVINKYKSEQCFIEGKKLM
jgi:glycosyltransferase involved in cell wall biosynthesis